MKRLEDDFALVCGKIMEEAVLRDSEQSFEDLCSGLNSTPAAIQNVFYERFGISGDEILDKFRKERREDGCKITRWFY